MQTFVYLGYVWGAMSIKPPGDDIHLFTLSPTMGSDMFSSVPDMANGNVVLSQISMSLAPSPSLYEKKLGRVRGLSGIGF